MFIMKNPSNVVHTIWEMVTGGRLEIRMIAWLNQFGPNHAFAHFCCWPETWGKTSVKLGKQSLKYWFEFGGDKGPL